MLTQGRVDVEALVARIRAEFPDLDFAEATLNDLGEDHAVVMLDDAWVFRFPRSARAASYAAGERRLLHRLNQVSSLAAPRYERVSVAGDFAGYRMIQGCELSEAVFAALPRQVQERVLDELGGFLARLHRLSPSLVASPDGAAAPKHGGREFARANRRRRARIASALALDLIARIDRFFELLAAVVDRAPKVLIHGDLSEDHILLEPNGQRLAGVIDFTDAGPGDPAFDFTFLWAYGDWAPARAAACYGDAAAEVLARSRWWFTRYSIDRLWWDLTGARACDAVKVEGDIRAGLDALGL
ncbi:MAG TPA: aminoglycoside phosphotransferase family protein [Caulobacteraceae bacterium]|nr:aminoglycoside phosphotransferase family protein [Caulobacteraceae bacterium]